jgi:hypothetical protein
MITESKTMHDNQKSSEDFQRNPIQKMKINIVIHMCMEAMLGISPYSFLKKISNKQKHCVLVISYIFSPTKSENKKVEHVLP